MPSQDYGWKRFWCPRSSQIKLSYDGYLCDPEVEWGNIYNPDLLTFEAISGLPCLALLGEPGIGKSHALELEKNKIVSKIEQQGGQVLTLELRSFGDEKRLVDKLFNSLQFNKWLQGSHQLHIFLDSFDECLLRIDTLATLLVDEFKDCRDKINRLKLRIACRTAVWPAVLEEGLKEIWGKDKVGIYELAPLRRIDVSQAATIAGIKDDEAFLEEINKKNVVPLAIKPITLEFLIKTYHRNGSQFPPHQRLHELYFEGCLWLCEERNKSRISSKSKGNIERQKRLIVAARIAAITIFGNKFAIWTSTDWGDVPDDDVLIEKICQETESFDGKEFEINQETVEEVLDTGLFSSRGELSRMGWAHQTYAEFLAAWYLKERQVKLPQILKLIVHPDDPDSRIIPQLYETVAWLASMLPEAFQAVMKTDPHVLLQSDVSTASDNDKASLVESLLKLHNDEKLTYQYNTWLYQNLNHPKLPDQLLPYICYSTKSINARNVAIDIAEACNVKDVQDYLANVALDPEQHDWIRINAAVAVCNLGNEKTKARLKPLAVAKIKNDVEEQLKGCGLRAVWPGNITTEELFNTLIQPVSKSIGGRYQDFIADELAEHLQISDLPVALRWLEKQITRRDLHYPFGALSDAIMLKAWEHLYESEILEGFAKIAYLRLKKHDEIIGNIDETENSSFKQQLEVDECKRRQLIEEIISLLPDSEQEPLWLAGYSEYSSLTPLKQDFSWLFQRLQLSESKRVQKIYAKLIRWKLDWNNSDQVSTVITASQHNCSLKAEFALELEPMELGSPRAEQAKVSYLELQNLLKPREKKPLLKPPPKQKVVAALERIESSHPELWWQVCAEMTLIPTSTRYNIDKIFEPDITKLPGWGEADTDTKVRIIKAAKAYLDAGEPETQTWLGTNNFSHPPFAVYQALHLLSKQEPDFIPTISSNIWVKWIPVILRSISFSDRNKEKNNEHEREIVRTAYQSIPNEFIETLIVLMMQHNYQPRTFYPNDVYRLTKNLLGEPLAKAIINNVKNEDLNAGMLEILLADIFTEEIDEARAFAVSLISPSVPMSGEARDKAVVAARTLILHADNFSWSIIWSAIQQDCEFGREVLRSIAFQAAADGEIEQHLKEEYVADLYIFLAEQYPDIEEHQHESEELIGIQAVIVGEIDDVKMWKNYIPQRLQQRGTVQACEALRKIIRELPELKDKLQWRLLEAETLARRQTWQPFKPEEILQIVSNKIESQSTQIQANYLIMQEPSNPIINFNNNVNAANINSTIYGEQIQHNYAQEKNLIDAFDEIQQIFNRLTENYQPSTEVEKQRVVTAAVEQVKQNPTLMKRVELGGKAFIFEALQKASDQWWVSPFVKAIEAGIKGE
ncbi:hypothetical protein BCD64_18035 [Nostoc sp. MBR 210]|nr:hypothetical protein BCD64_18035 [Nostoc sp. MBR 210]